MNKDDLISIIVPVYNASKHLDRCVRSILVQTYSNFELILVDDGSEDNSLVLCESYMEVDHRVSVIHQKNAGVSVARNTGLAAMKGKYFCFVDSDDFVEPEMVDKLYHNLVSNNADISICGFKNVSIRGVRKSFCKTEIVEGQERIVNFVLTHYLEWLVSSPWGKLYKVDSFFGGRFDSSISLGEDLKFNIQHFGQVKKIAIIEDCLYCYVDVADSLTKTYKQGHYEAICNIYDVTVDYVTGVLGTSAGSASAGLGNVNYKLFSFCISFMAQNMKGTRFRESKAFISRVCDNNSLQQAICDLPSLSFVRRVYLRAIKKKQTIWLWILSAAKYMVNKLQALRFWRSKRTWEKEFISYAPYL